MGKKNTRKSDWAANRPAGTPYCKRCDGTGVEPGSPPYPPAKYVTVCASCGGFGY